VDVDVTGIEPVTPMSAITSSNWAGLLQQFASNKISVADGFLLLYFVYASAARPPRPS